MSNTVVFKRQFASEWIVYAYLVSCKLPSRDLGNNDSFIEVGSLNIYEFI